MKKLGIAKKKTAIAVLYIYSKVKNHVLDLATFSFHDFESSW